MPMLNETTKKKLEKQGYRLVGNHSAVKTCGWTKSMIRGKGGCWKLKFFGINSNQCMQMTTNLGCANNCVFCWREYKSPIYKKWDSEIDDPNFIFKESIKQQHKLLDGFGGNTNKNPSKAPYNESRKVKHAALSLTGEPITYPKINELIKIFNINQISTFLVTKAQYPEQIKNLAPVTQLSLSLDAPEKDLLKKIDRPYFKDYWQRLNKSLKYLSKKKHRTAIRLTLMKGLNMGNPEAYAKLIKIAKPDFINIKAYMHVGASIERLSGDHMPSHKEVIEFSKSLLSFLEDYDFVTDHPQSWVVLLAKKKFKKDNKWFTWIDFEKYFKLVNSGISPNAEDYLRETPVTGIEEEG